jgi:hypothetical protein
MEHVEIKAQIGEIQLQLESLQSQANVLTEKKTLLTQALFKEMNKPTNNKVDNQKVSEKDQKSK